MSQTTTPDGPGHREEEPIRHDAASEPGPAADRSPSPPRRAPVAALVVGSVLCLIALALVSGGAFGLWKDVVARDSQGFVTLGSTELQTPQYAIVGDLQGDGPGWLYGSSALGDVRVRATSQTGQPVFIGIARQDDLRSYLRDVGYATVYSFEVSADTTHEGEAPSGPPSDESIWAVSTEGTGQQALQWTPQAGDWSVVFMNSDGGADVDVRGDASATFPVLPWLAWGLLILGGAMGVLAAWILVRAVRLTTRTGPTVPDTWRGSTSGEVPGGVRR